MDGFIFIIVMMMMMCGYHSIDKELEKIREENRTQAKQTEELSRMVIDLVKETRGKA